MHTAEQNANSQSSSLESNTSMSNKNSMPVAHMPIWQSTIQHSISTQGIGLHNGKSVTLHLRPAPIDTGIVFVRTDITGVDTHIVARTSAITKQQRCSGLCNEKGVHIYTIEHLMAALFACSIDNIYVEVDNDEIPALDGSAAPFLHLIEKAGIVKQSKPRRYIKVEREIHLMRGQSELRLSPLNANEQALLNLDVCIEFSDAVIGFQRMKITPDVRSFRADLAMARTFARSCEIGSLRANNLARGGSYDNAIVVNGDEVLNPGGLRYKDEFVRHKTLDLLGDLYIAGPLLANIYSARAGHALNASLLCTLMEDETAFSYMQFDTRKNKNPYNGQTCADMCKVNAI